MNLIRAFFLICISLLFASACQFAAAQEASETAPSTATCLTVTPGSADKPEYPDNQLLLRNGATIPVLLVFKKPDAAPEVVSTDLNADPDFVRAIKSFARHYRLPCMKADGEPVQLKQAYYFNPFDSRKVIKSAATDAGSEARKAKLACLTSIDGNEKMDYPQSALRSDASGNFYIQMRFTAPDQGPEIKWIATVPNDALRQAVEAHAANFRLPCIGSEPVTASRMYKFRINGERAVVIKDMTLVQFLRASKDVLPAKFDLDSMSCPFDLRVTYGRPYIKNTIYELETSDPARKPLLDWLTAITLKADDKQSNVLLGQSFTLSVPCGAVDL
jgi:hypothetical protein